MSRIKCTDTNPHFIYNCIGYVIYIDLHSQSAEGVAIDVTVGGAAKSVKAPAPTVTLAETTVTLAETTVAAGTPAAGQVIRPTPLCASLHAGVTRSPITPHSHCSVVVLCDRLRPLPTAAQPRQTVPAPRALPPSSPCWRQHCSSWQALPLSFAGPPDCPPATTTPRPPNRKKSWTCTGTQTMHQRTLAVQTMAVHGGAPSASVLCYVPVLRFRYDTLFGWIRMLAR